jgi:hypothetical protein
VRTLALVTVLALGAASVQAHHSYAATYVDGATLRLEGTVAAIDFQNPHSVLHIDIIAPTGRNETWSAEWAPVSLLTREGISPGTLKTADRLIVVGSPARDSADHRLRLRGIVRPRDGWKWGEAIELEVVGHAELQ